MFIVLSHHHCKPELLDLAAQKIDENGAKMTTEPGFAYRYRMQRPTAANIWTALTAWNDEADYQRFRQKRAAAGHDPKSAPYEKIESETYSVQSTHAATPV